MGSKGAPILLVDGTTGAGFDYAKSVLANKTSTIAFLGGTGAVPAGTSSAITSLWGGKATQTANYEETGKSTLTATQKGPNTIEAVSSTALVTGDKVTLKKGSTEQTMQFAISEDGKTITITTANKLTDADYVVIVTPADTAKAPYEATAKCSTAKLTTLEFSKELVLKSNSDFKTAYATLTGKDQFGQAFDLGSNVKIYASTATSSIDYNAETKTVTVTKGENDLPFNVGDSITLTAIYQNGTNVLQQASTLKVSNAAYVASVSFGDLNTTNAKLQGKRVIYSNFLKGTYYMPITAEDQYGNKLTADQLTKYYTGIDANNDNDTNDDGDTAPTMFVNPTAAQGVYGGFNGFDTLEDGTVIMKVSGVKGTFKPGDATVMFSGLGGLSAKAAYSVEDDPYIDSLNVTFDSSLYASTPSTFTVSATDQYGDPVDLYNQTLKAADGKLSLGDTNHMTNSTSSIEVNGGGTVTYSKKSATKTVEFTYTPSAKGTFVATITTAKPGVTTQTLTVGDAGVAKSIQKTLKSGVDTTLTSKGTINFSKALVVVDTNGQVMKALPTAQTASDTYAIPNGKTAYVYTDGEATLAEGVYGYSVFKYDAALKTYTIIDPTTNETPGETTTYRAFLLKGTATSGTPEIVDMKDFKITVTGTIDSYSASVAPGTELLWTGDTYGNSKDFAKIVVTGTDENGKTTTLSAANGDYTLQVDHQDKVTVDASNKTYVVAASKDTYAAPTTNEGTCTVTVYSPAGKSVASTTFNYSNAPQAATTAKWVQTTKDGNILDTPTEANENIDLNGTQASYDLKTSAKEMVITASTGNVYKLFVQDQYGLEMPAEKVSFDINGKSATKVSENNSFTAITNEIVVNSGSVTKKVIATVDANTYTASATNMAGTKLTTSVNGKTITITGVTITDQYGVAWGTDAAPKTWAKEGVTGTHTTSGDTTASYNGSVMTLTTTNAHANSETFIITVGSQKLTVTMDSATAASSNVGALD
jgi:hypothetical protein